jgi:hypothetical protein
MSVKIVDHSARIIANMQAQSSVAVRTALEDVKRISTPKTPRASTQQLRNNILIRVIGGRGSIKWGEQYAQYQERGKRKDGSRRVINYTTGGTGKHFAQNAIAQVSKKIPSYMKKAKI